MKQQFPRMLVFVFGIFLLVQYFVPHGTSEWLYEYLLDWIIIIGVFALAIGIWSLIRVHTDKIKNKKIGWQYSYVTLAGLFGFIVFGFTVRNGTDWGWFFVFAGAVVGAILMFVQAMASRERAALFAGLGGLCVLIALAVGILDDAFSFHFATKEGLQTYMFVHSFDYVLIPIFATMFSLLAFFIASAAYRAFRARTVMATLLLLAAIIVMSRFNPYLEPLFGVYVAKLSTWLMNVPNLAAQRAIVMGVGLGIVATGLKVILGIERKYMG